MSEQGPNGWPKPNLLKSTLEIIFVTTTIPILIVGLTIFTVEDFKLFNLMEPFILEWWNDRLTCNVFRHCDNYTLHFTLLYLNILD